MKSPASALTSLIEWLGLTNTGYHRTAATVASPFARRVSQQDLKYEIVNDGSWRSLIPEIVSISKVLDPPLQENTSVTFWYISVSLPQELRYSYLQDD